MFVGQRQRQHFTDFTIELERKQYQHTLLSDKFSPVSFLNDLAFASNNVKSDINNTKGRSSLVVRIFKCISLANVVNMVNMP